MPAALPEADELELSVFGRGYGEAICVHLGDGVWAVVDSCLNPDTGQAAALSYFDALGIPRDQIQLVVGTHWDDDHIRGLSEIVRQCPDATVALSAALRRKDILAFVVAENGGEATIGAGVAELRSILLICHGSGRQVVWAKSNTPLHPLPPGDSPVVVALSPSDDAFERSIESLIEAATDRTSIVRRRYKAPEGANGASIATSVRNSDVVMLLGADLENSPNPETGWEAVLKYSKPPEKSSIVKVPHHGSKGAHHPEIWTELVSAPNPISIVTPWALGAGFLPTEEDLERLSELSRRLYLTAVPSLVRARKDPELERMIRRVHGSDIEELRGWGHVLARRRATGGEWQVELAGDAIQVAL